MAAGHASVRACTRELKVFFIRGCKGVTCHSQKNVTKRKMQYEDEQSEPVIPKYLTSDMLLQLNFLAHYFSLTLPTTSLSNIP
jgi:hypothetical protein